jgi:hypothetical protein
MIFLSYTWPDRGLAHELDRQFRLAGLQVWIDYRNLDANSDLLRQLDEAIRGAEMFVSVSHHARATSSWMSVELAIARAYEKAVHSFVADERFGSEPVGNVECRSLSSAQKAWFARCVGVLRFHFNNPSLARPLLMISNDGDEPTWSSTSALSAQRYLPVEATPWTSTSPTNNAC